MGKWEYLVLHIKNQYWGDSYGKQGTLQKQKLPSGGDWWDPAPIFSNLGMEGWELVSADLITTNTSNSIGGCAIFKRALTENS